MGNSGFKAEILKPNVDLFEQLKKINADETDLIVVGGNCFFKRKDCVNESPYSGWKCSRCGYDADGFRGRQLDWGFCPRCGSVTAR